MKTIVVCLLVWVMPIFADDYYYIAYGPATNELKSYKSPTQEMSIAYGSRIRLEVSSQEYETKIVTNLTARIESARNVGRERDADFDGWDNASLKALVKVLLDEINILRQAAGLQPRTAQQLKNAIKAKL